MMMIAEGVKGEKSGGEKKSSLAFVVDESVQGKE
jgi:hypothetical protein